MYDERTRQRDDLWASLAYAQKEVMRLGIEQGYSEDIELGKEQERINTIIFLY